MTVPTLTSFNGVAPDPTDSATFDPRMDQFISDLFTLVPEFQASVAAFNVDFATIAASVTAAQAAETGAMAAANYVSTWAAAGSAAGTAGESYSHDGKVWALLVNVADLSTSQPSLSNSDWSNLSPVDGKLTFSTSGTGSAGDPVAISANDTVEAVANTAQTQNIGTVTKLDDTTQVGSCTVHVPQENCVVAFFTGTDNDLLYAVGTISGDTITWGTTAELRAGTTYSTQAVLLDTNRILLISVEANYPAAVVTVDGTAKTCAVHASGFQNTFDFSSAYTNDTYLADPVLIADNKVALLSRDNADTYPTAGVLSVSDGTITTGSELKLESVARNQYGMGSLADNEFHCFTDDSTNGMRVTRVTVDGTTCEIADGPTSEDNLGDASGTVTGRISIVSDKVNQRYYGAFARSGSYISSFKVSGATVSDIDQIEYSTSLDDAFQLAWFPDVRANGAGILGLFDRSAANSSYPYFYQFNVSTTGGLSEENSGGTQIEAKAVQSGQAGRGVFDPDAKRFVFSYCQSTDNDVDAVMIRPVFDDTNADKFIGFADSAFVDASTVVVTIPGGTNDDQSSLLFSVEYGLQKDGSLDYQDPSTWYCRGLIAKSATEIINSRNNV